MTFKLTRIKVKTFKFNSKNKMVILNYDLYIVIRI